MIKIKDVVSHVNHIEQLCTPQFTHLPCVRSYLIKQAADDFALNDVAARDIVENITSFCHLHRKVQQLKAKVSQLED